jgi:hypothetical protein
MAATGLPLMFLTSAALAPSTSFPASGPGYSALGPP